MGPHPEATLDTRPNEGLADTVVVDIEVVGDCCEGHTSAVERCGSAHLVFRKRLTAKLNAFVAEEFQQATL